MTQREGGPATEASTQTEPQPALDLPVYEEIDPADLEPQPFRPPGRRRVLTVIAAILVLLALALGPPLVNVSRYQHEIATSISASLGHPVRMSSVSLTLLPVPSFVLENFSVADDPAFGAEPILRANRVRATLRLSSLWRHRVEFSTITLDDPSVNLVHLPDGRWNLESVLLQASRVPVAPTAQKRSSEAPRFPYIEATGARVNLKEGLVKQPLSLTDARFALWLPEPNQWHLRLEGHPNRTDVPATDTGRFRVEGTLGRAATLEAVPVDLDASWSAAPLGGVSWVILGRDAGVRGDLTLHAQVKGTVGANQLASRLELHGLRRADFVPAHPLDADIGCTAQALEDLHRLDQIACHWPRLDPADSAPPSGQPAPGLSVTGTLPELMRPASIALHASWTGVPASTLLDAAHAASQRLSPALTATGTLSGEATCCASGQPAPDPDGPLSFNITGAQLSLGGDGPPLLDQTISAAAAGGHLIVEPVLLHLNAGSPADTTRVPAASTPPALLTIDADWTALHLHLTGPADRERLFALTAAVPQFGEGLAAILPDPAPDTPDSLLHLDADATRPWFGSQTWTAAPPQKIEPPHRSTSQSPRRRSRR